MKSILLVEDNDDIRELYGALLRREGYEVQAGQAVRVSIEPAELQARAAVRVTISDDGPGIAPELLPRIFDPYVAGGSSTGLGLGLYLARTTLSAHGGTISMQSKSPRGTRCEVVLPLSEARE